MDTDIRLKVAFALVRGRKSEEAIRLLTPVVRREPDNGLAHYNWPTPPWTGCTRPVPNTASSG